MNEPAADVTVHLMVNGAPRRAAVPARTSLADLLRDHLHLTGTHLGCEHGACGACTVLVDGAPARACLLLAAGCDGADVVTVEGLTGDEVDVLRAAFRAEHGLQCGFCTPGILITALDVVRRRPNATADEIRVELSGNLCRCTGYVGIVNAVQRAASELCDRSAEVAR